VSARIPGRRRPARSLVVVGGGISGLAAARVLAGAAPASGAGYEDHRRGDSAGVPSSLASAAPASGEAEVVLVEGDSRLGGKVFTGNIGGVAVELGPDQFLRRDASAERLARMLGLGDELVAPAARAAAVYSRGRLCALPGGLVLGVPTDEDSLQASGILSPGGLATFRRLAGSPVSPAATAAQLGLEEPVEGEVEELPAGAILRPLVGDEVVERLVDPLLGGINAGSVDQLSLAAVAPQIARLLAGRPDGLAALAEAARAPSGAGRPSPFFGLSGGLSRLVEASRRQLQSELGARIITGSAVTALEQDERRAGYVVHLDNGNAIKADAVVIALPGPAAGRLLSQLVPQAAARLAAIPYASVTVATMAFERGAVAAAGIPPEWSGALVPRVEGAVTTAVSFLSAKWPWMAEAGGPHREMVRVSAGRYLDERIASEDDRGLVRRLLKELTEVAGISDEPAAVHVQRWERSFPQYLPGHGAAVAAIRRALPRHPRIALAGASLGGIGIPACISSGERAAEEVLAGLER
jgi:oxygen-dependent protoporphyrinogen oxidase